MKKLTFLFLLINTISFSQSKYEADSLILLLPSMPDDTNKVWVYEKIVSAYVFLNPRISEQYIQKEIDLARKLQFKKGEVFGLMRLGQNYQTKSEFVSAFDCFMQALNIAEAIEYKQGYRRVLGQMTSVYRNLGDYDKALEIHRRVLKLSEEINFDVANAYRGTGETYLAANKLDSALYYTLKAYEIVKKDGGSTHSLILVQLANVYRNLGDNDKAMSLYKESIETSIKSENLGLTNQAYSEMAILYKRIGKIDSCIFYKEKMLRFALKAGFINSVNSESRYLASIYDSIAPSKALKYYRLEASTRDSVFNQKRYLQIQSRTLEEQRLQQEKVTKEEQRNNELWRNVMILALLFISIVAFILFRNNKLKQQANQQLQEQKKKVENTLSQLKATQTQLIQSEKLASLGELTAGIAHEIQNPLNFVNNFSELSVDLAKDLNDEIHKSDIDKEYVEELLTDLTSNQEKINHHGKRASSIVKGMLEHSRASTGVKELTDINKLADEYLRLSYHGLRAKDKEFNADFTTQFDKNLPKIEVIPQDIGRVLLNLINSAFYAVNERAKQLRSGNFGSSPNVEAEQPYTPSVLVTTQQLDNQIIIKVKDNGTGMPESVRDKVFQPFFTTKPTGQGTGLGLSLAYDIVTKGHGGTLEVESTEGLGTEFRIHFQIS